MDSFISNLDTRIDLLLFDVVQVYIDILEMCWNCLKNRLEMLFCFQMPESLGHLSINLHCSLCCLPPNLSSFRLVRSSVDRLLVVVREVVMVTSHGDPAWHVVVRVGGQGLGVRGAAQGHDHVGEEPHLLRQVTYHLNRLIQIHILRQTFVKTSCNNAMQ